MVKRNDLIESMFEKNGWVVTSDLDRADLVQFTGGSDVSPDLYGENKHPTTYNSPDRDRKESFVYRVCLKKKIPMAGICRGGQFLNVMNGGKLYQHVDGHSIRGTHNTNFVGTPFEFGVTSTHHQMMRPHKEDGLIILRNKPLGSYKLDGDGVDHFSKEEYDIESVYYEKTNSFCFQPHPEYEGVEECRKFYFKAIEGYLGVE